jgi:hypothetical protein
MFWLCSTSGSKGRHSVGRHSGCNKGRPDRVWSEALGAAFLALVEETGNARQAARVLGYPHLFNNRMKRDPAFRAAARAAAGRAEARLGGTRGSRFVLAAPARAAVLATDAAALGGFLRPGRKRAQARPEPVVRRNSRGRTQISFAREGHWTSDIEADFLARVRASGNIAASARAVGFQPASVRERMRNWPAFKGAVDQALEEASVELEYALTAHAHALVGRMGGEGPTDAAADAPNDMEDDPRAPFDAAGAMRILGFLDARRARRTGRAGKGPPERTFDAAVASVMRKIEAIERHKALRAAEGEE